MDLVPFLCGVAEREDLPGPVLVRLLTDLGLGEAAARTLLARMRTRGALRAERHGRMVSYRLAGATAAAFRRVQRADRAPAPWAGVFHGVLYTVPEEERAFRDALRRAAMLAGYGPLRPGLSVSPHDRWDALADAVSKPPAGARVYPVQLRLALDDARTVAAEAWNLDELAARYRQRVTTMRRRLASGRSDPPPTARTLRTYTQLLRPAIQILLVDPGLPDELLPPDWPRAEVVAAVAATEQRFQGPSRRYVDSLLDGAT